MFPIGLAPYKTELKPFWIGSGQYQIQLVKGLWEGIQLSIGRESLGETYSTSIKARLAKQSETNAFNYVFYGTANINTQIGEIDCPISNLVIE